MVRPVKLRFLTISAVLLLAAACSVREQDSAALSEFSFALPSDEVGTRVCFGEFSGQRCPLLWAAGDRVMVNGLYSSSVSASKAGTSSVVLTVSGSPVAPYHVVHPAGAWRGESVPSGVAFPATQTHKPGSCPAASTVLACKTDDAVSVQLSSLSAYIRLNVAKGSYDGSFTKITFWGNDGEALAGEFAISFDADGRPVLGEAVSSENTVTLTGLSETGEYVIAIPAQNFAKGFTVTVYGSKSDFMRLRTSSSVTFEPGVLINAPAVTYSANGYILGADTPDGIDEENSDIVLLTDFESRYCERIGVSGVNAQTVANPLQDKLNPSDSCLRVASTGGAYDCLAMYSPFCLDYALRRGEIRLKILPPRDNAMFAIKLSPTNTATCPETIISARAGAAGEWGEVVFDISGYGEYSNFYRRIYFYPDYSLKMSSVWYIDDVMVPDDDISDFSLFRRVGTPLLPDISRPWMCNSIANPEVLYPSETIDGKWWLLARGGDGTYSRLGYYTQNASSFNPLGPWNYHSGNPVIDINRYAFNIDGIQAIDPCGFTVEGKFYFYYKGMGWDSSSESVTNNVLLATTTDGVNFTKAAPPWKTDCGVADVVKWNGKYWLYVARRIYEFTNLMSGDGAVEHADIITLGGAPDNCDWYSINGGKLFRLEGVDKWFLCYQAGTRNPDFPGRFHLAYSDDLVNWTKVNNNKPLFTRGPRGAWDQGAIWAPSVFEYDGTLYMYYEGWGVEGDVPNRDEQYFLNGSGGHSQIGIAACSKADFLSWCGF